MQLSLFRQRLALLAPAIAVTIGLCAPLTALAQSDDSVAADGTGVARISLIEGTVGVQRGDSSASLTAALNAPLLGGDYITTGNGSRTEIQFDGSAQLRLGPHGQLRFTRLDSGNRAVQLAQGTLELNLWRSTDGSSEIDTPSISIKPQEHGRYRVTVTPDGRTLVTVRSGAAEVDTPGAIQTLTPGSTLVAQGAAGDPSVQTVAAVGADDFDRFNAERDQLHDRSLADTAFVNSDIGGIEDLEGNGQWVTDGSYGHVWVPASTGPDWAPYRDGRWVWEDGYGWTWVGAERWGWAPYHYGSWYRSPNYGWCWYPPRPHIEVPWRPALVAFIGFGSGAGFSLGFGGGAGFGNIGWVPLAPFEPYHPWWGNRYGSNNNPTIINNVTNVTNVTNVNTINVYRNVRSNGVSSVTSQRFLQGDFSHNQIVGATELRRAQVFRSALPIVPTASNLRFTNSVREVPLAVRPAVTGRMFAGSGGSVRRTSFVDQRVALASVTHAPLTPLHFKDARTTPMVLEHHSVSLPGIVPATPQNTAHRFNQTEQKAPNLEVHNAPRNTVPAARPASGAAVTDPWARFNASRAIDPERRKTAQPIAPGNPAALGTYHQAPAAPVRAYHQAPAPPVKANPQSPATAKAYRQLPVDNQPKNVITTDSTGSPPIGKARRPPQVRETYSEPAARNPASAPAAARVPSAPAASRPASKPPSESHSTSEQIKAEPAHTSPNVNTERPPNRDTERPPNRDTERPPNRDTERPPNRDTERPPNRDRRR